MKYIIETCIALDIAILGIAYPILIDKISNIGEKYKSEYLSNIFDLEFPQNKISGNLSFLKFILIATVFSFIFKILDLQPINGLDNFWINNSADIIILLLTILLTISFFFWLDKVMLYQGKASKLLKYLILKYELQKKENQSKTYLLKSINEMTIYAIENQDEHLQKTLLEFYYKLFSKYRNESNEDVGVEYPIDLYFLVSNIISTSIDNQNRKLVSLEHRASSGKWLIGEGFEYSKISKATYTWLWRNLVLSSDSKKLISNYWSTAVQFFNYSMRNIEPHYEGFEIQNQDEIDLRSKERDSFLEFNYALGGLLFYKNNYTALSYILSYSQSQPPQYILLPQTMDEIFHWFDFFSNEYRNLEDPIEYKYSFPDIDNLGVSRNIAHNICMYIALLFVRQFTLNQVYVYQDFKRFHSLTNNLQDLYSYNERLPYFKNCINKILSNTNLIEQLNYNVEEVEIIETFEKLELEIKNKIDLTKLSTELSVEKVTQFKESAKQIITSAFDSYTAVLNSEDFKDVDQKNILSINGEMILSSKSSFTDNDIPNINFDTVYASHISNNKIKYYFPNSFLISKTDRYLIERENLIEGLAKILNNLDNKIIIPINLTYDVKTKIEDSIYKPVLKYIPASNNHLNNSFFILDKKDLPKIEFRDISDEEKAKFKLEKLDDVKKLYSSVIDINKPENLLLKEEYLTTDDSELKVLILISFISLIKWRKNRKIVLLSLVSPFQERGIVNDLEDLKSLF